MVLLSVGALFMICISEFRPLYFQVAK